jgi:hypothetical protein
MAVSAMAAIAAPVIATPSAVVVSDPTEKYRVCQELMAKCINEAAGNKVVNKEFNTLAAYMKGHFAAPSEDDLAENVKQLRRVKLDKITNNDLVNNPHIVSDELYPLAVGKILLKEYKCIITFDTITETPEVAWFFYTYNKLIQTYHDSL